MDLRPRLRQTEPELKRRFADLLERAHFVLGEEVASFEDEFARAMGARYAVSVANGTGALELSLRAHNIRDRRDEVLTTPLTAGFTGLAILAAGRKPRFADVDPETLLLDPSDVANRVTRKTGALLPVHLYGQACDLPRFASLARSVRAALVQDACQAHAACFGESGFTAFSPYVAYSFYPTKNLGCLGDGGAVVTDNASVAARLRLLRDGGRRNNHVSHVAGVNSRLDEMQASFLRAFLARLVRWTEERRKLARIYEQNLAGCPGVHIVSQRPGSVYHLFVIRVRRRERLRNYLAQSGIGTAIHYSVPLHLHPAFRDCGGKLGEFPYAEKACREILSLPLWTGMTQNEVCEVAGRIRGFYSKKV